MRRTDEQLTEIALCSRSPAYFIKKYVKIWNGELGLINIELNKPTLRVLARIHKNDGTVIKKSRQIGCSTINCAYILWMSLFHSNHHSVIFSRNSINSSEFTYKIKSMYCNLPEFLKSDLTSTSHQITFENGSTIISLVDCRNFRNRKFDLLYIDEYSNILEEELLNVLETMFCSIFCTKIILSSTSDHNSFKVFTIIHSLLTNQRFVKCRIPWHYVASRNGAWKQRMIESIGIKQFNESFLT